jgi:hypothetical protein
MRCHIAMIFLFAWRLCARVCNKAVFDRPSPLLRSKTPVFLTGVKDPARKGLRSKRQQATCELQLIFKDGILLID